MVIAAKRRLSKKPLRNRLASEGLAPGLKRTAKSGKVMLDIAEALAVLLDDKESFSHHKEILFAGFQAWVVNSRGVQIHQDALLSATCDAIVKSERSDPRLIGKRAQLRGLLQFFPAHQRLYDSVYYPLGGMKAVRAAIGRAPVNAKRRLGAAKDVQPLIRLARLFDQISRQLPELGELYFESTIKALSKLPAAREKSEKKWAKGKATGRTQILGAKKDHESSWGFLYGASLIELEKGKTLLDCLLSNSLKFSDVGRGTLATWVSYAAYFRSAVLERMDKTLKKGPTLKQFSKVAPSITPLSDDDVRVVESIYQTKKPSEARLQFRRV